MPENVPIRQRPAIARHSGQTQAKRKHREQRETSPQSEAASDRRSQLRRIAGTGEDIAEQQTTNNKRQQRKNAGQAGIEEILKHQNRYSEVK
jgi:hypothetical protein